MRKKAKARSEAELWVKVQRSCYGAKRGTKPTTVTKQPKESQMETAVVSSETNDMDWLSKMIIDMEENVQSEKDDINIMNARNVNFIESIKEIYDEEGDNELNEEEL